MKAEARKPEEVKKANLEKVTSDKIKVESINNNLKGNELYNQG